MRTHKTKKIAFSAILAALAVVFLYVGALLDVLDLSAATAASFCVALVLCELGKKYALLTYAAAAVLSLLLLPNKLGAVYFLCFLGFYPIAKEKIEQKTSGLLAFVCKLALLNLCMLLAITAARFLFSLSAEWLDVLLLVLANGVFLVYDFALGVLLRAYVFKWRKKLKIRF